MAAVLLALGACEHAGEEVVAPQLPVHTVQQRLAVDWRYGSHSYEIGSVYNDDFGHVFRLDTLRFLVSGAQAVDDDGAVLADYYDVHLLIDAAGGTNEHLLGELTSDHLHEIRFNIGLQPAINHSDPTTAPPPLNDTTMHSGSTAAGYFFLQVCGHVDGNGDGTIDGTDQTFRHLCIGDDLLCPAAAVVHANLPEGGVLTAWLPVDMEVLLSDIDLLNTPSSSGDGPVNTAWMQRLMDAMEQEH